LSIVPGKAYSTLFELAAEQHGYFTTTQAQKEGVGAKTIGMMFNRGVVDRVSHGVYRFPHFPMTELSPFMEAVLWPHQMVGVLSHESALRLYELSDVNPRELHITLPTSFRVQRQIPRFLVVHHSDLDPADWHTWEGIPVTTPTRTITDCTAAGLGSALMGQALEEGVRKGLFNQQEAERLVRRAS
jgi:predicted transcriptional regulator of viral defense system